jgi:uncharacterized protein YwgA
MDSPITKVTRMIRLLQLDHTHLENEILDKLDYVVHLLGSNHLFEPQLQNTNMETEVNQWLKQITNHNEAKEESRVFNKSPHEQENQTGLSRKKKFQVDAKIANSLTSIK